MGVNNGRRLLKHMFRPIYMPVRKIQHPVQFADEKDHCGYAKHLSGFRLWYDRISDLGFGLQVFGFPFSSLLSPFLPISLLSPLACLFLRGGSG